MKYLYFYLPFWTAWRFSLFLCPYMWTILICLIFLFLACVMLWIFLVFLYVSLLTSAISVCRISFLWLALWCILVLYYGFSWLVGWLLIYEYGNWMYWDLLNVCLDLRLIVMLLLFLLGLPIRILYALLLTPLCL